MSKSPFKFLDSYTIDDRKIFFGREREIEELYHRVFESRILLIYGISGTGKSSLINCGLANKFQATDWLPVTVRRGANILESFPAALQKMAITPLKSEIRTAAQFRTAINSLYLDHYKPIYFIFDQFEELFIFGSREEKKDFIQVIKPLIESDLQCRFLFIMREEYLAGVTEFEKAIPSFYSNRVRIEKMSMVNAKEAITGSCKAFDISLEEGFPDGLLEKLSPKGSDVELTYLQVYLDRIFRLANASEKAPVRKLHFSNGLLQKAGNVGDLLGSFLEEQITQLKDPDIAMAVLKSFVSVRGTKQQMSPGEIEEYSQSLGKPVHPEALQELIQTFINLRILRDKDQNGRYELRHDALAARIYEKISLVEKELMEIRQFIENSLTDYKKRGKFLSKEDLSYIAPYEERLFLSDSSRHFIQKCKKEITRSKRRIRTIALGSIILIMIIFAGFTIWAVSERGKAIRERELADIQRENALTANEKAKTEEEKARNEKNRALENEKKAIQARQEAENARRISLNAEKQALLEKNRAISEHNNAEKALEDKIEAEKRLEETARDYVLSPLKMNILYKGIENPIVFAIPGNNTGKIHFQSDNNGELLTRQGIISIIPYETGNFSLTLIRTNETDTATLGTRIFRVKNLPQPIAHLEGSNSGYILTDSLVKSTGISVKTPDFDFNVSYKVLGYKLTCLSGPFKKLSLIAYVDENNFSLVRKYFSSFKHNDILTLDDISVVGPDSLIRDLGSLSYRVFEWVPWEEESFFREQINETIRKRDWDKLKSLSFEYTDKYYSKTENTLNSVAYNFYLYISDTLSLGKALKWAEKAVDLSNEDPLYMDTQASILFKLGRLDEAEKIEKSVISKLKAQGNPTDYFENVLNQIRNSR
jgi:hypothetical protein